MLNSDLLINQLSEEFVVEPTANGTILNNQSVAMAMPIDKPELTCISEEGVADMDLPENMFDLNAVGDCITPSNKVID